MKTTINKVIKPKYVSKTVEVTKDNIVSVFSIKENRRNCSAQQIRTIVEGLEKGIYWGSPFVVCIRNKTRNLIDGNHRYEALLKYFLKNPTHSIIAEIHEYQTKTEQEEKEIYTLYNSGRKQSTNDFIQQYKETIPLWLMFQTRNFPVRISVYPNKNTISFFQLVTSYLATRPIAFNGGYSAKPLEFIAEAKQLGESDFVVMREFLKEYILAFGNVLNNRWYKGTPLTAIMRIWLDNKGNILPDKMIMLFRERLANDFVAQDLIKQSGMGACKYAKEKYLQILNANRIRDLFIGTENVCGIV